MSTPAETFKEMGLVIERYRPDLMAEFETKRSDPIYTMAHYLNQNFPMPGGWGQRACEDGPADLLKYFESQR